MQKFEGFSVKASVVYTTMGLGRKPFDGCAALDFVDILGNGLLHFFLFQRLDKPRFYIIVGQFGFRLAVDYLDDVISKAGFNNGADLFRLKPEGGI